MSLPERRPTINRQEFLRLVATMGLATALISFLEACNQAEVLTPTALPTKTNIPYTPSPTAGSNLQSTPTMDTSTSPTSIPTANPDSEVAEIAFVMTPDRTEGVRKAIDLLGINPVAGKSVFVKPNFNSSDPAPGSTHPDVLRTTIGKLREMGAQEISLGDRSGMGSTRKVMETIGVYNMGTELGFEVIDFGTMGADDWVMITPPDSHWKVGFPIARPCIAADALVQTCCLKTHAYGGHFTMSLKNSVGMVATELAGYGNQFMDELHTSSHQRKMIAEINTAYTPALIILDGVEAFTSGGPAKGRQVAPEVVLAGTDRIAIDAVGVALLRYFKTTSNVAQGPIFKQEQIARAVELGLGVDNPYKIKLITGDTKSEAFAEKIHNILVQT
ncbi:MAG: DUF362 domain-containing protein [Anaerolineales bacterium]